MAITGKNLPSSPQRPPISPRTLPAFYLYFPAPNHYADVAQVVEQLIRNQ
jgi:hypothetical protein